MPASTQEQAPSTSSASGSARALQRLDSLSARLSQLSERRQAFITDRGGVISDLNAADTSELQDLDTEIEQLTIAFETIALGDIDVTAFDAKQDQPFNWQQELSEVAAPIVDSIKNVTEKPRQISSLRSAIDKNQRQIQIADQAIDSLRSQSESPLTESSVVRMGTMLTEWESLRQRAEDQLVSNESRLKLLEKNEIPINERLRNGMRTFVLGRGLTLLLAAAAAVVTWLLMRGVWWIAVNKFITKNTRRKAVWFRLVSYSFALLTGLIMFIAFIAVLQLRQDTLLLAIALVLVVTLALGLRNYLPNFINETRLLLNIGPVREEERVILNNMPWNVESINLQTVLRNPALNGVLRLPISDIKHLTSRPYRDELWFPTERGDYILLPDETFGQIMEQTPELVQLKVRGGMIKSFTSADFYALPIINMSRGETFGIATTFGLDYGIQDKSLNEIPATLKSTIQKTLVELGYNDTAENLMVELNEAGASSLDYLIYAQFPSENANEYFKLRRAILQACISACNDNGWSIPFPQMVMHQA